MNYVKIEDARNPTIGEYYLVLCAMIPSPEKIQEPIWHYEFETEYEYEVSSDGDLRITHTEQRLVAKRQVGEHPIDNPIAVPVHNHPHNDIENGQPYAHYHIDTRFVERLSDLYPIRIDAKGAQLEYHAKQLLHETEYMPTGFGFIASSKLKHKCIHKGKCPHRGYNLSNIQPVNGEIHCPLHGLRFDAKTKKLLNAPSAT